MSDIRGIAVLNMPAAIDSRRQGSPVQWEEPDGCRAGPLVLTLGYNVLPVLLDAQKPNSVQAPPLPSMLNGMGYNGLGVGGAWGLGPLASDYSMIGSMVLDLTQGSVHRTVVADLRQGSYQLPPCDSVRVSVRLRRALAGPAGKAVFQAQIAPGSLPGAQELLFSDVASVASDVAISITRRFYAPEGASNLRLVCNARAGAITTQNPAWVFRGAVYGSGGTLGSVASVPWVPSAWNSMLGLFGVGASVGASYVTGAQWRVDL